MTALVLDVNRFYSPVFTQEERDVVLCWIKGLGYAPDEVYSVAVVGEGVVEVEHAVDRDAGLFDHARTTVRSPVLPPFINRFAVSEELR